ncbi:MAG: outer membrane lipoprotein carrier protein LolA [Deltaproteobacteria bacterium]|nr:outer membrane lipoprotein carrier protein LolA [Deltaproteobacteria bacterium]
MDVVTCVLSYGLLCSAPEKTPEPAAPPAITDFDGDEPVAEKGAASKVLAKVQKFYDGTTDFGGDFKQTYVHPVYGTKTVSTGKLRVKKPGKMVWDYSADDNPDFWVDGTKVTVVERDTKQVLRKDVDSSDFAGAEKFLFGGKQLLDDFLVKLAAEKLVTRYGMAAHTTIRLKPKQKSAHYKELLLVVDDATGRVDAFVVLNGDGSTNHFVLSGVKTNTGVGDDAFEFVKPKGFTEIEG